MKTSEQTAALFAAFSAAQSAMIPAAKDGKNPHFRSTYTTLGSVLSAVLPPLNKHGLALSQHPSVEGDTVHLETFLFHKSGQWMSSTSSITMGRKTDAHAVGSAITYLRRYAAQAICGLPSVDDDANVSVGLRPPNKVQVPVPSRPRPLSPEEFRAELVKVGVTVDMLRDYCQSQGKGDPAEASASQQAAIIRWLKGAGAGIVLASAFDGEVITLDGGGA